MHRDKSWPTCHVHMLARSREGIKKNRSINDRDCPILGGDSGGAIERLTLKSSSRLHVVTVGDIGCPSDTMRERLHDDYAT